MKTSHIRLFFGILLLLLAAAGSVGAHEPYLLLTANGDGTFTAETGFSDGSSPGGLKIAIRDRGTGEVLSEYAVPAHGKLTLEMPNVPYRVTFDGGPGHRISKPGPERGAVGSSSSATVASSEIKQAPELSGALPLAVATSSANVTLTSTPAEATTPVDKARDHSLHMMLLVGVFFLFGAVAFALGYSAGRSAR